MSVLSCRFLRVYLFYCFVYQLTLLKAGCFEVLLLQLSQIFDPDSDRIVFTNGEQYEKKLLEKSGLYHPASYGHRFLLENTIDKVRRSQLVDGVDAIDHL